MGEVIEAMYHKTFMHDKKQRTRFSEQSCGLNFNSEVIRRSVSSQIQSLPILLVSPLLCTRLEKVHSNSTNIQNSFTKFIVFCFFLLKYIWAAGMTPNHSKKLIKSNVYNLIYTRSIWSKCIEESWLTIMSKGWANMYSVYKSCNHGYFTSIIIIIIIL